MKRVLILATEDDFHAYAIQAMLRKQGADADVVDTGAYPTSLGLTCTGEALEAVTLGSCPIGDYHSIWYRRSRSPRPSDDITNDEERRFASRECEHALLGALYASGKPIYNNPDRERAASRKPYQLKVAHELGLRVPRTLITTSAAAAAEFVEQQGHVIHKVFTGTDLMMADTRPMRPEDVADLWRLQYAPVILQEYLELSREFRVEVIENDCFVSEIRIENPKAHYDWRLDEDYRCTPATLPDDLLTRLVQLTRALGLSSGAVDLRETPDGVPYFLEINPTGQFLFLEIYAGLPVGERFCRMLLQDAGDFSRPVHL
jgi:glutathione synthase/RimK-type ligase-like ATP-grasp enzyme